MTLGAFLSLALPISKLPVPTGPYAVGTSILYLVDDDRPESYTKDSDDVRELMVQLWYPVDKKQKGDKSEYIQQLDIAGPALAERLNLPSNLLDHLGLIRTNAIVEAPIYSQDGPYPMLIFSHGLMGIRMQNSFQMEELASHGYVVASPDHTYDSVLTVMPDGRVLFHDNDALFPEDISQIDAGQNLVSVRSDDLSFVLNRLEDMNQDPAEMLYEQLNLNQVGFIGHSTGGGTILETCFQDDRCKASVALDSWVEVVADENQSSELPVPVLFMNSEDWLGPENKAIGKALAANSSTSSYEVTIAEAHHNNFTDIPLLSPLTPLLDLAGPVDGRKILKIINDFSVSFFDKYLKGFPGEMSDKIEPTYPEVLFEVHRP
jgi:dienelactone hydrolase